jgi:hypothetical protein
MNWINVEYGNLACNAMLFGGLACHLFLLVSCLAYSDSEPEGDMFLQSA